MKVDLEKKTKLLAGLARFDVSGVPQVFAGSPSSFIYPACGVGTKPFNLFKVLLTNLCQNNCFYCANRRGRDCLRLSFKPEELVNLFLYYYRRRWVKGLFLSSGIFPSANQAQEKILEVIQILRRKYNYLGYIHAKILPGADEGFIKELGLLANRLSINLEAPGDNFLKRLTKDKNFHQQLYPALAKISQISRQGYLENGVTTQLIAGAAGEPDSSILFFSQRLYQDLHLTRIYYSGFSPVKHTPLENLRSCSPLRELRLYQADFLLRNYGFKMNEFVFDKTGNLLIDKDPKLAWAEKHPEKFPVEINQASWEELLRVPGIGRISARRIISQRRNKSIHRLTDLSKLGAVVSRAGNFITLAGKMYRSHRGRGISVKEEKQLFFWEDI